MIEFSSDMPLDPFDWMQKWLQSIPQMPYPCHSRMHHLKSYSTTEAKCYVKREDELGFGISGPKIRKYRSLISHLLLNDIQEVIVIGSHYSNHVLGISQLLIENGLKATFFLRGDPTRSLQGNTLFSSLFIPRESVHWISKAEWKEVDSLAQNYATEQNHPTFVIPEGGSTLAALPGALTLSLDIIQNEKDKNLIFDHIFIDAGTGLMAIALILGFTWLNKPTLIHVVLMAEKEEDFLNKLNNYLATWKKELKQEVLLTTNFNLYKPALLPAFGRINQTLFQFIKDLAKTEGFLTDPVYSAKLFFTAKSIIKEKKLQGNILIIHSGGSLTLAGYTDYLKN